MNIPGYDQMPPDEDPQAQGDPPAPEQSQGYGLHHHTIDEDEAGGFHSVHTHPDGRQDPADHADYDEAKAKQDSDFGCGGDEGMDDGQDDSFGADSEPEPDNIAADYGNKA